MGLMRPARSLRSAIVLKPSTLMAFHGRAHMALGPGIPDPPKERVAPLSKSRHRLDDFRSINAKAILGGLRHEYSLARA